jgi:multiple sugar transport system substrate-binding protein
MAREGTGMTPRTHVAQVARRSPPPAGQPGGGAGPDIARAVGTARASGTTRRALAGRVAALSALTGAGAACAPAGTAGEPGAAQKGGLAGRVVFYTRGGEVETRGQQEILVPTFKKEAPDVEVSHEIFSASSPDDSYTLKLYALYAAGSPPDVFGFGQNYYGFWARGMLADLTPRISRDKVDLGQFHAGLPDKLKIHGKHYGLPQLTTFGTLLFYNKSLLQNAGIPFPPTDWDDKSWTFDAMLDAARKLTKNPGEPDAVYGLNYSVQGPHSHAWLWGGDTFLPEHYTDGIAQRTLLDSPESGDGHQFTQDIRWKYQVSPRPGTDPTTGISFLTGRYALEVNGGWNFWGFTVIKDFAWGAAALPTKATNKNCNYNDFWELSSQSKNPDAAWAFIKHLTTPDTQREYSRLTGTPPTTKAAMDVWYQRYEGIIPRAELEKVTQGAISSKRSQESGDHVLIDWSKLTQFYTPNVTTPLLANQGSAKDLLSRAKPGFDAVIKEIYDTYKGKTPS